MDHDGNRNVNDEILSSMPRLMSHCCCLSPTKMMMNEVAVLHLTCAREEPSAVSAAAAASEDRAMCSADSESISDAPQMELNRDTCSLDD